MTQYPAQTPATPQSAYPPAVAAVLDHLNGPQRQAVAGLLDDLNEPQRQAVLHRDGPLLVIAGPGSGKTRVITRRAACLVHRGVPARNILAITFTNKAAAEMRERIEKLGVARGMWVYTFHALCVRLLREIGPLAGVQPGFSIYDETDAMRAIKEAMAICQVSERVLTPDKVRGAISDAKARLRGPKVLASEANWHEPQLIARVYEVYEKLLRQRNALDFDDLLLRVAVVLRDHEDVAERLNARFRYLLIDEYQDTNQAQYLIARSLSQFHENICATGDPDQSIYAWRGANIRNILEFERDFPQATVIRLEQNYRSTGHILRVADQLIAHNRRRKHKTLWTENGPGEGVELWQFATSEDEAEQVAQTIADVHAGGRPWSACAIFYRTNALSRGLEEALRARGIPYKIARGVEFYNRKEIRDVLAYLRVLVNPADDVALLRIINTPARGIGKTSLERLVVYANETGTTVYEAVRRAGEVRGLEKALPKLQRFVGLLDQLQAVLTLPVSEALSTVLRLSGLEAALKKEDETEGEDRLANVQELVTAALRYEIETEEASLADFLNRVSLTSDQDAVDEQAGCVMLMTLHAAKGLEFDIVFLVGLEQGLLPHERSLGPGQNVEEERRLCFVGITRARQRLYMTRVLDRWVRGRPMPRPPSQFLREFDSPELQQRDFQPQVSPGSLEARRYGYTPMAPEQEYVGEEGRRWPRRRVRDAGEDPDDVGDPSREAQSGGRLSGGGRSPAGGRRVPPEDVASATPFGDWTPGTLVHHDRYGVGQILWIRFAPGQTRAGLRFAGFGEKTLILELAPVRKLARPG